MLSVQGTSGALSHTDPAERHDTKRGEFLAPRTATREPIGFSFRRFPLVNRTTVTWSTIRQQTRVHRQSRFESRGSFFNHRSNSGRQISVPAPAAWISPSMAPLFGLALRSNKSVRLMRILSKSRIATR